MFKERVRQVFKIVADAERHLMSTVYAVAFMDL
jgi:hypothetical protein